MLLFPLESQHNTVEYDLGWLIADIFIRVSVPVLNQLLTSKNKSETRRSCRVMLYQMSVADKETFFNQTEKKYY